MTFEELMGVAHSAVRRAGRSTEFADRVMIRAVVEALREEILPNLDTSHDVDAESVWTKFNEILASDGVKSEGSE